MIMPLVVAGSCSLLINMKYKFYKITTQIIYIYIVNEQLYFTYLTLIQVIVFFVHQIGYFSGTSSNSNSNYIYAENRLSGMQCSFLKVKYSPLLIELSWSNINFGTWLPLIGSSLWHAFPMYILVLGEDVLCHPADNHVAFVGLY